MLATGWVSGYLSSTITRRIMSRLLNLGNFQQIFKICDISSVNQKMADKKPTTKPPNVLVYTGKGDSKRRTFECVKENLLHVLNRDCYVIYELEDEQILDHPWAKDLALLVVNTDETIEEHVLQEMQLYFENGGKILSLGCGGLNNVRFEPGITLKPFAFKYCTVKTNMDVEEDQIDVNCEHFFFKGESPDVEVLATEEISGHPVILHFCSQTGKAVFCSVNLLQNQKTTDVTQTLLRAVLTKLDIKCTSQEIPSLSPAYLFGSEKNILHLMQNLKPHLTNNLCKGKEMSLFFCDSKATQAIPTATEHRLPVVLHQDKPSDCRFDWQVYQRHLNTQTLGKLVLYTDVIPSTQTLLEGNQTFVNCVPNHAGIMAVTSQQVKGKGRSGNAWLSPIGSMMFSIIVRVDFGTELGARLPYIQHIAALAFIEAVRELPGYENIDIRLKWPNDIYYGRDTKIGGVVVSSTAQGNALNAVIGMGVNVSNKEPTICINDIIQEYNDQHSADLAPLPIEMVLARTVNCVEQLIEGFQVNGKEEFQQKYYKRWLHSGSKVTLRTSTEVSQEVTIVGLDNFGFLLVEKDTGERFSVQPDGNSFDLLANLIEVKVR